MVFKQAIEKIKKAEVPVPLPSELIKQTRQLAKDVRYLNDRVKELEKWRDFFGDPNIKKNISNIGGIFDEIRNRIYPNINTAHSNIQAIFDDIKNNISPSINKAHANINSIFTNIQDNILPKITAAETNIIDMLNTIQNEVQPRVNEAMVWAKDALTEANKAVEKATGFLDILNTTATGLRDDSVKVWEATTNMISVIGTETLRIANAFITYGKNMNQLFGGLFADIDNVRAEIEEAYTQISKPLNKAKSDARKALDCFNRLRSRGWNHSDIICILDEGVDAIKYLTIKGYDGQDSVLDEIQEAIWEIMGAFGRMAGGFRGIGTNYESNAKMLSSAVRKGMTNIRAAVNNFILTFRTMVDNLTNRLKQPE